MAVKRGISWLALSLMLWAVCAGGATLTGITIKNLGADEVDEPFVHAHISAEAGQELDLTRVSKDVRALLATGRFSDVRTEIEEDARGLVLVYCVRNKLRLGRAVEIVGAKHFSIKELRELLDLGIEDLVDDSVIAVRVQKLSDEYREDHYPEVEIGWSIDVVDEKQGVAVVKITVDEGNRITVAGVVFKGNTAVSSRDLRYATNDARWWNPFSWNWFRARRFDSDELEKNRNDIRLEYLSKGYLDAKVSEPRLVQKGRGNVVEFIITEGSLYTLGDISTTGISLFPEGELLPLVAAKRGEAVSIKEVVRAAEALRKYYSSRGYLRTTVKYALDPAGTEDGRENVIDISFVVTEGSLAHVRNVLIKGNTETKEEVIRRELTVYPGDKFNESQISRSERRLWNLGYFGKVRTSPVATPRLDEYDLVFDVEEKRTGNLMLGGGFSDADDWVGYLEIQQGNFDITRWPPRGGGQKLKFRGYFGGKRTSTELSFVEPWFLGRRLSLGLDLYATERNLTDFDVQTKGGAIRIGKSIRATPFSRLDVEYRRENAEVSDVADTNEYTTASGEPFFFTYDSAAKSQLMLSLKRDTRNNVFTPSEGHKVTVTGYASGGILGGDVDIVGWWIKGEKYFPSWRNHIIGFRGRLDVKHEYGDTEEMSVYDRLYVGGGRSIRGFESRGVGPKVTRDGAEPATIGGRTRFMATAEYVIPIVDAIHIAAFVDAGNAVDEEYGPLFESIASSAGVELRFFISQFLPVKVSYGIPLSKDDELTETRRWGFWMGPEF